MATACASGLTVKSIRPQAVTIILCITTSLCITTARCTSVKGLRARTLRG